MNWIILTEERREVKIRSLDYSGDGSELPWEFKMFTDDNECIYEGRCQEESFDPLDEFGKPNWGCTTIRYLQKDGRWLEL